MAKRKSYQRVFTDPRKKIESGKPWKFPIKLDPDVAELILDEESNEKNGFNYTQIINKRLRKGYGVKQKK
jgi:hypothetical protein